MVQDYKPGMASQSNQGSYPQVERVEGEWKGQHVRFKREFGGHRFTDAEVADLLADKPIHFEATSRKTGKTYTAWGKLGHQSFTRPDGEVIKYIGFGLDFNLNQDIPDSICGVKLTDDDKKHLKAGERVHKDGLKSKSGKTFGTDLTWEDDENGRKRLKFNF